MSMRARVMAAVAALLAVLCVGRPSLAGDPDFTATGKATGSGDSVRVAALDRAFRAAVQRALSATLSAEVIAKQRDLLTREILGHARLYVARFSVTSEQVVEGELQLTVVATIHSERLATRLGELGIDASRPIASVSDRPGLVLLLKSTEGDQTRVTFGSSGGDGGSAGRAMRSLLESGGFRVVAAGGAQAPLSTGEAAGQLPVDDAAAAQLARSVGAGGAVVVGVRTVADGPIRATDLRGWASRANVRVVDAADGHLIAEGTASAGGYAVADGEAAAAASVRAVERGAAAVMGPLGKRWPQHAAIGSQTRLTIEGAATWAAVSAIIRQLAASRGIDAVHPRRVGGDQVVLGVETDLPPRSVAAAAVRTRLDRGSLSVTTDGAGVRAVVSGDSRRSELDD